MSVARNRIEVVADEGAPPPQPVPAPAPGVRPAEVPSPGSRAPESRGAEAPSAASLPAPEVAPRASSRWRRRALMLSVPVLLAGGGGYVWVTGGRYVTTDNAYVQQPMLTVAADVAGRIVAVDVAENQAVAAGAPLFRVDPEPYRIALEQAEGGLEAARLQVDQLRSGYATAEARLAAAEAILEVRTRELERQRSLSGQGIDAAAAVDAATLAAQGARNEEALAREGLAAAAAALGGDPAIATDSVPAVRTAQAALDAARLAVGQLRAAHATAEARLTAGQAILEVRTRELDRQRSLSEQGVSAQAALDEATLAAQAAENEVALAREGVASAAAALGGDPAIATDDVPSVRSAQAGLAAARLSVDQLRAAYATAEARLAAAQAIVAVRDRGLARESSLAEQDVAGQAALDQAILAARAAENEVALARQGLDAARAALGGDPAIATEDVPSVRVARAQADAARRALSETEVVAPAAGLVAQVESLNVGQYVAPGTPVASLVESDVTWIEANFKETQLDGLAVGQPVEVEVDAYPGVPLHGTVESLGSATGSQFSLIPAQNATGNWVKVVQRVPVRIAIAPDAEHPLRGGMSAEVAVDTGHSRLDGLR